MATEGRSFLCEKQKCCVKKRNVIRNMFRSSSLSGFPIGNTFSLLFVRFVEFSGKNRFKYVAMFHCRIFSITRALLRYGDVSCDLIHSVLLFVWFIWCFFNWVSMANWVCFFISNVTDWLINLFSIRHGLVANVFPAINQVLVYCL